ncbi:lactococcin 972 family bacteriocin [Streptomyces sp. SCA3-4]|uniref:lactococcin 972 family bacteriocin n=1 Tax=Streptomyces sichuanensis TaxID=2871810 RepID=UPI001CE31844|nr:lactococcin 972 family bacteriocin [Streptomyces sichuanensis]MCA6091034.1 lactococcin 972 family bacteriocin [Streptomyces sichuanensis]
MELKGGDYVNFTGRSILFAVAGAAIAAVGIAAPATADAPATAGAATSGATFTVHHRGDGAQPPAGLGNPSEWGVATFRTDASANSARPSEACVKPSSGGTWCYGWYTTEVSPGVFNKYCYSNYWHKTRGHASTVKIAGNTRRDHAAADETSNAHLTAGLAYTCSTYYSVD